MQAPGGSEPARQAPGGGEHPSRAAGAATAGQAARSLEVGRVVRSHGLGGDVVVELVTNREERVAPGATLQTPEGRNLRVCSSVVTGQQGPWRRFIVAFEGVVDRAGADELRGSVLLAEALDEPGALWVHELIGSRVRSVGGDPLGSVVAVQSNPASDLLVLDGGALVPLCFVIAAADAEVTVELPAGLLDL